MKDIMLLDYENFQPENLSILKGKATKVFVFVGAKQKKLPLKFALSAQALGQKVEYVEVARSGKNALDFHIAFHLGRLAEHTPKSRFVIVSKDTGFDPLIGHLKDQGLVAKRIPSLAKLAPNCSTRRSSKDEKLAAIVANLHARGAARPAPRLRFRGTSGVNVTLRPPFSMTVRAVCSAS